MQFDVINPTETVELLSLIGKFKEGNFRFCAGGTDLLIELKHKGDENLAVINLVGISDPLFKSVTPFEGGIRIGALATVNEIVANKLLSEQYPVLHNAAHSLASCQIREVATVGGNLCTASPAGDISCAMVALDADCEILSSENVCRVVRITDFFTGVRKTCLKPDEILRSIVVKANQLEMLVYSDFIKVGTRRSMECAVISLAYHFLTDSTGRITQAGVAIGSAAPTIRLAIEAGNYLCGLKIEEIGSTEAEYFADKVVACSSPISDARGSAWYRKEALYNISKGIFDR